MVLNQYYPLWLVSVCLLRRGEVWDPLKAEQERALREQIEKDREHEDWLRQVNHFSLNAYQRVPFVSFLRIRNIDVE